jgi:hypothetical protein
MTFLRPGSFACASEGAKDQGSAPLIRSGRSGSSAGVSSAAVRLGCAVCAGVSGGFVTGFGEGEPLVTEVGDDFKPAAECLDVGGECAQFGGSWLGVLDG